MKKKQTIPLKIKPVWKVAKGHPVPLSGAGTMGDRRTKRMRTRKDRNAAAIEEQDDV